MSAVTPGAVRYLLGPGSTWRDVALAALDLALVAYLIYRVLLLIRGTRAVNVLFGLFLLGLCYLGAQWTNLVTLQWVLGEFLSYSFLFGVVVLFQADIRRGLARLGAGSFLGGLAPGERRAEAEVADAVVRAAAELSRHHRGALIAIERTADLSDVIDSGVRVDAAVSPELLLALFHPGGALHDGAVVLQRRRVAAAGCLLPLSPSPRLRDVGTRHRAALGLCEEVDAVVVVVSEERGEISLAVEGALERGLDEGTLRERLAVLVGRAPARGLLGLLRRRANAVEEDRRAAL